MVVQIAVGWWTNSLALLADAAHLFVDAAGVGLSLLAVWFAERPATAEKTYGYYRVEILAALVNGVVLCVLALAILVEAWERLRVRHEVSAGPVLVVAVAALGVNLLAARLLHAGAGESLNVRSAYLEVLGDALSSGAVITIRPGTFKAAEGPMPIGIVIDKSAEVGALTAGRRYLETIAAESSDVDITKHAVLVSIGRGIQEKDNVGIAEELAEALGAAVSCSRPVVDAKWLQKSRQVGSSGKTVKPKVYLACGISGAFQHLAGIKGNPFIIAINKNAKAPIFQVADVGIVDDLLEFLPQLTSKVQEMRGVAAK